MAPHGDGRGDVEAVVLPLEVVFVAVGQRGRVAHRAERRPLVGHRRQHGVVAAHEGAAARCGEPVVELALAAPHPLRAAEAFEVGTPDVGQQPVVGLGDRGQQGDLAAGARPHLHDAELRVGIHRQQRQRHADVIVQVALRGMDREALGQHAAYELLGRRLAVAARDGEDRDAQCAAVFARQLLQGAQRVGHEVHARVRGGRGVVHDGVCCPLVERLGGEAVAVEGGAVQREEDRAGHDAPRVGRDARAGPEKCIEC